MNSPSRNAPCPCGSGKRYKECHGRVTQPDEDLARVLKLDRRLLVAGTHLERQGDVAGARRAYEQVLALDAQHPDALHLIALLDLAAGDARAALERIDRAIASYPRHAPLHASRARILERLGRGDEPDAPREQGSPLEAEALGRMLRETLQHAEAVEVYRELVRVGPADDVARHVALLADSLVQIGRTEEARRLCEETLERKPAALNVALPAKLSLKPVYADPRDVAVWRERYSTGLADLRRGASRFLSAPASELRDALAWSNFYLAYQGGNDLALQAEYADFVAQLLDRVEPRLREPIAQASSDGRRIRIGFASHYFYECSAGRYFASWITGLDRDAFEVFVYHVRPGVDAVGRSLEAFADHFRRPRDDEFLGSTIRSDALDILVYPELGGNGATFVLAALRLAPVQCAGWGHPVTTGHATIDYFFSSDATEPADAQSHYRERLVRLPGIGTDYAPPQWHEPRSSREARETLGLPLDRRLYLFPQSIYKIHPDNDVLLVDVLAEDRRGLLLLFPGHTPETTGQFLHRLAAALAKRGMDVHERVLVLPIMSRGTYMQVNAACDVMLDSLHWSGGNTSLDAFAAGLPVVTLPGAFMRGRQTLGMLEVLGIPELVVADAARYVESAVRIANDQALRSDLAARIDARRPRLFHDRAAVGAMQDFYRRVARSDVAMR